MRDIRLKKLSPREAQVLQHVAQGLTNKEIAKELGISPDTVKDRVKTILVKTDSRNRAEASVWAVRWGGQ